MKKNVILALLMTIAMAANAMGERNLHTEARTQTDRMAAELRLTAHQRRQVYDINLHLMHNQPARDRALNRVLTASQFRQYMHSRHAVKPPKGHKPQRHDGRHHIRRHHK